MMFSNVHIPISNNVLQIKYHSPEFIFMVTSSPTVLLKGRRILQKVKHRYFFKYFLLAFLVIKSP